MLRLTLLAAFAAITTGCKDKTSYQWFLENETLATFRHFEPWLNFWAYMAIAGLCLTMFAFHSIANASDKTKDTARLLLFLFFAVVIVVISNCLGRQEVNILGTLLLIPAGFAIWWKAQKARQLIGSTSFMQSILDRRREARSRRREPKPTDDPAEVACPHCRTDNPQGYTFCSNCGKRPHQQPPPTDSATRDEPDQPARNTRPRKKHRIL